MSKCRVASLYKMAGNAFGSNFLCCFPADFEVTLRRNPDWCVKWTEFSGKQSACLPFAHRSGRRLRSCPMHNVRVEAKEHSRLYLVTSAKSDYKEHVQMSIINYSWKLNFAHYHIALNFHGSLISWILQIFNRLWKYFNESFWHAACGVCVQRIHEIISMKSSKIAICENLDPRKFSAIQ